MENSLVVLLLLDKKEEMQFLLQKHIKSTSLNNCSHK
jgi:hypothetical protein